MSTQFDAGYLRADTVIRTRPNAEPLRAWVEHWKNRPSPADTDDFRAGYDKRCREAFEMAGLRVVQPL